MSNIEQIREVVINYTKAVHTQNKEDFLALWANDPNCTLISITNLFVGAENIYQEFLIDRIQKAYSVIDLIADSIDIRPINDNLATVVFQYHTECLRRDTGEPFGIEGLETQVIVKENDQWKLLHVHYSK